MNPKFKPEHLKDMLPYFVLAVAVIVAYKIINELDSLLFFARRIWIIVNPFFNGLVLAYVLNIPCGGIQRMLENTGRKFLQKRKVPISIIATYILSLLLAVLVLRLVIPSIYSSISLFIANFQSYYRSAQQAIDYINSLEFLNITITMNELMVMARDFSIENISTPISALFSVSSAIFNSFLTFISSVYILSEKEKIRAFLCRLIEVFCSETVSDTTLRYAQVLNRNFKRYLYTQTIDGCILGTIATIELSLLGSEYALLLGILLGVVNYIPYFGSIVGSLVAITVMALTKGIPVALLTAAILLVTQQIDGNIIQPRLLGGSFSLSPLLVIVSITVGGAFWGVPGMIAAIPFVAVLRELLLDIVERRESRKPCDSLPGQEQAQEGNPSATDE